MNQGTIDVLVGAIIGGAFTLAGGFLAAYWTERKAQREIDRKALKEVFDALYDWGLPEPGEEAKYALMGYTPQFLGQAWTRALKASVSLPKRWDYLVARIKTCKTRDVKTIEQVLAYIQHELNPRVMPIPRPIKAKYVSETKFLTESIHIRQRPDDPEQPSIRLGDW